MKMKEIRLKNKENAILIQYMICWWTSSCKMLWKPGSCMVLKVDQASEEKMET